MDGLRRMAFWGILGLAVTAAAADDPQGTVLLPCAQGAPGGNPCQPPKKALKKAGAAFARGLRLEKAKKLYDAELAFEEASRLSPQNVEYATAREIARQHLVYNHLQQGNRDMLQNRPAEALAQFREASQLDPKNQFAQQRLHDALQDRPAKGASQPAVAEDLEILRVAPRAGTREFHFRGQSRVLLTQVASAYGLSSTVDDSVVDKHVRFDLDAVDFYQAIRIACKVTHSFWVPVDKSQIHIVLDSAENHRQYDRLALRVFPVPGAASTQDVTDAVNLLRTIFEIKSITPQPANNSIAVKAPVPILDAATKFLEGLDQSRPQLVLDIKVYEVSNTLTHNLGIQVPNNFQLINIGAAALSLAGTTNIQNLINQLIASGAINQGDTTAIATLLKQLQSQNSSSLLSTPVATFGGGLTLFGLTLGTLEGQLSLNSSSVRSLDHAILRAAQGNQVSFNLGSRYPILNATFAPISNSSALSSVLANNTFQSAFPSFSYEDIGLTIKAKPTIHRDSSVSLELNMTLRSLLGQSANGVPFLANREYSGTINLEDGEPAAVVGAVSRTEQRSMQGYPELGATPILDQVIDNQTREDDNNEFMIVVTPHVATPIPQGRSTEVWMQ
jgi:general secretion pathway protein D